MKILILVVLLSLGIIHAQDCAGRITWNNGVAVCIVGNECVNTYDCAGQPIATCVRAAPGDLKGTCTCPSSQGFTTPYSPAAGCACANIQYLLGVPYCLLQGQCIADYNCPNMAQCVTNGLTAIGNCMCRPTLDVLSASPLSCGCGADKQLQWINGVPTCVPNGGPAPCTSNGNCAGNPFSFCNAGTCACLPGFGQYTSSGCSNAQCAGGKLVWRNGVPGCIGLNQCLEHWMCASQPYAFCPGAPIASLSTPATCQCRPGFDFVDPTVGCVCNGMIVYSNVNNIPICLKGNQCLFDWNCAFPKTCQGENLGSVDGLLQPAAGACM